MCSHLHNLILQLGEEEVDDLVLLDGERVEVDLLHALDLAGLYETTELGDGLPFLLVALTTSTASTTAATATPATITTTVTTGSETTATVAAGSTASISHICDWKVEGVVELMSWGCCRGSRSQQAGDLGNLQSLPSTFRSRGGFGRILVRNSIPQLSERTLTDLAPKSRQQD